jgi:hypothetical protein
MSRTHPPDLLPVNKIPGKEVPSPRQVVPSHHAAAAPLTAPKQFAGEPNRTISLTPGALIMEVCG